MSQHTIRPDGYVTPDSSVTTGAASIHAATSDNSDSSYVRKWPELPPTTVFLTTATKPANSVTKQVRAWVRASSISVNPVRIAWWFNHAGVQYGKTSGLSISGTTPVTYWGPWVAMGDLSQTNVNDLTGSFDAEPQMTEARFYEFGVDIHFAEIPTLDVTGPTGTFASSTATATWSYTAGADGEGQAGWRGVVYTAAQFNGAGFAPFSTPPTLDSGSVWNGASSWNFGPLGEGTYRVYVGAWTMINGVLQYSTNDYSEFTIDFPPEPETTTAEVLAVNAAVDAPDGRVEIIVDRDQTKDAWHHIDLQRLSEHDELEGVGNFSSGAAGLGTGWITGFLGTPTSTSTTLETTGGIDGQYQRIAATLDNLDFWKIITIADARVGEECYLSGWFKGTLAANCTARLSVFFSTDPDATAANASAMGGIVYFYDFALTSSWKFHALSVTTPSNARRIVVQVEIVGLTGATAGACTLDADRVTCKSMMDGWVDVRNASVILPNTNQGIYFDYEVPPHVFTLYRARAVKSTGTVGSWVYSEDLLTWDTEWGVWVKSITSPNRNVQLYVHKSFNIDHGSRRGVFHPIGAKNPITVTDVRSGPHIPVSFLTSTEDEYERFMDLIQDDIVLLEFAPKWRIPGRYWSLGPIQEVRPVRWGHTLFRSWVADDAIEVDRPS